jgi:protein SCO1
MTMQRVRIILWVLVALALAAFAFLMLRPVPETPTQQQPVAISSIGGPFTLTDSNGKPFSSASLAGKPYAIFFGFTHCPDVCPTTLARMVRLRQQLAAGDRPFEILFVTVDPERDGPAEVGKYAELFNSPVTGLTGSPAQIDQVKKQFGVFSQKVPDSSGGYSVDHTATVLLFDRKGDFSGTIAPEEGDKAALAKLKRITA